MTHTMWRKALCLAVSLLLATRLENSRWTWFVIDDRFTLCTIIASLMFSLRTSLDFTSDSPGSKPNNWRRTLITSRINRRFSSTEAVDNQFLQLRKTGFTRCTPTGYAGLCGPRCWACAVAEGAASCLMAKKTNLYRPRRWKWRTVVLIWLNRIGPWGIRLTLSHLLPRLTGRVKSNQHQSWKPLFYVHFIACQQEGKALDDESRTCCPTKAQFPSL